MLSAWCPNSEVHLIILMKILSSQVASVRAEIILCLVLLQVPKCFGLVQIFCASPKIHLHIVAVANILCQTKRWFAFSKSGFSAGTKVFEEALNAVKFLGWLKKFRLAQNILGPVKGQGITGPKMFCAGPNLLSQPKNLTAFSASSKTFVPAQKPILLNVNHLFVWHKMFVTGTLCK